MRKILTIAAATAFVAAMMAPIFAADMTVKGEVVDLSCAMSQGDNGKGDAHAGCAMTCAKGGSPLGILTDDAVFQVTGDYAANQNAKMLEFVAKKVEVTGEVSEKDGNKMIAVKSIKLAN